MAETAGHEGLEVVRGRDRRQLDAVALTAYAIVKFSGIDWDKIGLKCPIDPGGVEREYFQKHYLSGRDIVTADGLELAHRVLEQVDPSFGRERKPPDKKSWPRCAQLRSEHFNRVVARLPAKAMVFNAAFEAFRQQCPDLAAEIEAGARRLPSS